MKNLFINPEENRLRSGWRLAVQTGLLIGLGVIILICLTPLLFAQTLLAPDLLEQIAELAGGPAELVLGLPIELVIITLSVYLARRFADRRSFASLGLWLNRVAWQDMLMGILLAGLMIGLMFLIQILGGWLTIDGYAFDHTSAGRMLFQTLALFIGFVVVGWVEELLFRGYWLQNLSEGLNIALGVVISSVIFALAHIGNPGFNLAALTGLFLAGVFFAYSLLRAGNLWLPIGLHIGWNFFEGPIFGFQVSGMEAFRLIEHHVEGPDILVGGAFGPEAGLVLLAALALGALLIYLYTRGRNTGVIPLLDPSPQAAETIES